MWIAEQKCILSLRAADCKWDVDQQHCLFSIKSDPLPMYSKHQGLKSLKPFAYAKNLHNF